MEELINCRDCDISCFSLEGQEIQAKITNVYDADTCKAVFYLADKLVKYTLRLKGIDTPEIRPRRSVEFRDQQILAAKQARNRLIQIVTDQEIKIEDDFGKKKIQSIIDLNRKLVKLKCHEFDKYGRLLAEIIVDVPDEEETSKIKQKTANQILIDESYAYIYDGGTKRIFKPK
tara:strand:- start:3 stop:524 length:522 start_codon:yes stop_codon:yes gene_type:complete